jgi:hypothetical protein
MLLEETILAVSCYIGCGEGGVGVWSGRIFTSNAKRVWLQALLKINHVS